MRMNSSVPSGACNVYWCRRGLAAPEATVNTQYAASPQVAQMLSGQDLTIDIGHDVRYVSSFGHGRGDQEKKAGHINIARSIRVATISRGSLYETC
jgi:hypothetical protein